MARLRPPPLQRTMRHTRLGLTLARPLPPQPLHSRQGLRLGPMPTRRLQAAVGATSVSLSVV